MKKKIRSLPAIPKCFPQLAFNKSFFLTEKKAKSATLVGNKEPVGSRSSSKNSEITNDSSTSCFAALGNNNNRKKKGKQKRRTSRKKVKLAQV